MSALTMTDAKQPAIVRRALETALTTEEPLAFGPLRVVLTPDGYWIAFVVGLSGDLSVFPASVLTTERAVTTITEWARGH